MDNIQELAKVFLIGIGIALLAIGLCVLLFVIVDVIKTETRWYREDREAERNALKRRIEILEHELGITTDNQIHLNGVADLIGKDRKIIK